MEGMLYSPTGRCDGFISVSKKSWWSVDRAEPNSTAGTASPCHFILEFSKKLGVFSSWENFLRKVSAILWHYEPYVTVLQPIPVKNDDIDFDIVNFSRNVQSNLCTKKNNRLMGAKISQKVSFNKLLFSCGPWMILE